jgi:hypothetical protein
MVYITHKKSRSTRRLWNGDKNKKARDIGLREPRPDNHTDGPEFSPLFNGSL